MPTIANSEIRITFFAHGGNKTFHDVCKRSTDQWSISDYVLMFLPKSGGSPLAPSDSDGHVF